MAKKKSLSGVLDPASLRDPASLIPKRADTRSTIDRSIAAKRGYLHPRNPDKSPDFEFGKTYSMQATGKTPLLGKPKRGRRV